MKKYIDRTIKIFFSIAITFAWPSMGQWKQYLYTDGISSNYTFQTHKDDKNRIWIGTQNGVTLINGSEMKKFGSEHGLPASDVTFISSVGENVYVATSNKRIYELKDNGRFEKTNIVQGNKIHSMKNINGKLFVSTNLENIMYDGEKISFMKNGFPKAEIKDIFNFKGETWFVSEDQIIKKKNKKFEVENIQFSKANVKIQSFVSHNGIEYFGTNKGFWAKENKKNPYLIKNMSVVSLNVTDSGYILIGSKKGVYYFSDGEVKQFLLTNVNNASINSINYVSENEIWYSTFGSGVFLQDMGTFKNIYSENGFDPKGMVFDIILWKQKKYIATKNGLFVFDHNKVEKHLTKKDGLPSNVILDLDAKDDKELWLATSNGLSKYTGKDFLNFSRKNGLPSKLVTTVHVDRKTPNTVWTGSENSGLTRYDKNGFFTYATQDGLPGNSIRDITQLPDGNLVLAVYNKGVALYNGKSFQLIDKNLDDKRVIIVTEGPKNLIWAGTESAGIAVMEDNAFTKISDLDGLGHNEIFSMHYDGKNLWAGTFGGGVSVLADNNWFTLRKIDGLNSNTIGAIHSDSNGMVFLGGNNGLSILNPVEDPFRIRFNNILTPKAEISYEQSLKEGIAGIVDDRFYLNINPIIYNPTNSKVKYRTRLRYVDEDLLGSWSFPQENSRLTFSSSNVGLYEYQIQGIDNRLILSEIVKIKFSIGRVWYLDPKTAIPFWGGILFLFGFSIITYINFRKKTKEANDLREAEIARQQAEMEEAREFQQAMLPKEMPKNDNYDIVGFQQTATEVGGDFFDFMQREDGSWVAICGDATGHGLTSGNVVSITKTAMSSLIEEDPIPVLDSLNKTLLKMNIGLNRMCLNIAAIGEDSIKFSSAGMPPAYYYSSKKNELKEILVGALPLGSFKDALHMEEEIPFENKGDILVMMSDGLPEAENVRDEMVGYERTEQKIRELSDKSAEELKDGLVSLCDTWLEGNAELKDDMTFVIIKKK